MDTPATEAYRGINGAKTGRFNHLVFSINCFELENRQRGNSFVGSNPTPSAIQTVTLVRPGVAALDRRRLPCRLIALPSKWPTGHGLAARPGSRLIRGQTSGATGQAALSRKPPACASPIPSWPAHRRRRGRALRPRPWPSHRTPPLHVPRFRFCASRPPPIWSALRFLPGRVHLNRLLRALRFPPWPPHLTPPLCVLRFPLWPSRLPPLHAPRSRPGTWLLPWPQPLRGPPRL